MAKRDTETTGDTSSSDTGPAEGFATDLGRIGGSQGTDLQSRVDGLESLLGRITGFLSWLFPGHAVPGTDREGQPGLAGPDTPPAPAGPAPASPTAAAGTVQSEQPTPPLA